MVAGDLGICGGVGICASPSIPKAPREYGAPRKLRQYQRTLPGGQAMLAAGSAPIRWRAQQHCPENFAGNEKLTAERMKIRENALLILEILRAPPAAVAKGSCVRPQVPPSFAALRVDFRATDSLALVDFLLIFS